jgi:eukaryotic-like serine/threonine-protein kinase
MRRRASATASCTVAAASSIGPCCGVTDDGSRPAVIPARIITLPLALTLGTRLGVYEITAPIGEGGMGQVFRATDTKLKRQVAIKILPPSLAGNHDRLARFRREAEVLASLNHPHIAGIYGLEESDGIFALVMELVEGEDLSQRIERGAIPIDEALPIAMQIAEALEGAHEQGIIHRDLKPANIKVRADGTVKVLDFGLAKAMEPAAGSSSGMSMSPTVTTPAMTQAGMILGTAAYMSPEQARGGVVDKRSDIWTFGVVCIEILTGRRLFEGGTVSDTIAAVLRQDIDWRALPSATPPPVVALLRRCLDRDMKRRLRDIGEARIAIETATSGAAGPSSAVAVLPSRAGTRAPLLAVTALAAGAVLAAGTLFVRSRMAPDPAPVRVTMLGPSDVSFDPKTYPILAISRDGSTIAFAGISKNISRLYVRRLAEFDAHALPETDGATEPAFSPDGTWVAFFADGTLKKTPVAGGPVISLASGTDVRGLTWTDADTIVFTPGAATALSEISASGGAVRPLTQLDPKKQERTHRWPAVLPDQKTVLFNVGGLAHPDDYDDATIEGVRIDTGERRVVMSGGRMPRYAATGHLLYVRGKILYSVAFDPKTLQVRGRPSPVTDGVMGDPSTGAASFGVADNGTLAYLPGNHFISRLSWVDLEGRVTAIDLPSAMYAAPRVSPDGRKIAYSIIDSASNRSDVWVADLARGTSTRLTVLGNCRTPLWSHDGRRVFYITSNMEKNRSNIETVSADGNGSPNTVGTFEGQAHLTDISADGSTFFLTGQAASGGETFIYRFGVGTTSAKPTPAVPEAVNVNNASLSPDGRWLAFVSSESGRPEIVVQSLAPGGGRTQVSTNGGGSAVWSSDGRTLYYMFGSELFAVPVELSNGMSIGKPRRVFGDPQIVTLDAEGYFDAAPDGRHFLMLRAVDDRAATSEVRLILNWFTDLRRIGR